MRNFFNNLKDEDGNIAVIVALGMVVLLGFSAFVLDLGVVYNQSSKLQNALDSAALAAAQKLPAENTTSSAWLTAKDQAMKFADLNKYPITSDDIQPVYKDNLPTGQIVGVKITKGLEVDYNFARVLGINSGTVTRAATAALKPAGGLRGGIPLSITDDSLSQAIAENAVTGLTIKSSSNAEDMSIDCTEVSGWFGALQFDGTGASIYSNLLAYGYSGNLYVGQILNMEKGNMSGPTLEGFSTRYDNCHDGCTADNFEPDCPRLVYIPVVEVISKGQVKIVSFAAFFLLECGGNGNNSYIKATYIDHAVLPDSAPGSSGKDYGVYVTKLSE